MKPTPTHIEFESEADKRLFEPPQVGDEFMAEGHWLRLEKCDVPHFTTSSYRRRLENCWLVIKDKPVQYPCWIRYDDNSICHWNDKVTLEATSATHWQPAVPAPKPPRD